jgi:hypothetical protein
MGHARGFRVDSVIRACRAAVVRAAAFGRDAQRKRWNFRALERGRVPHLGEAPPITQLRATARAAAAGEKDSARSIRRTARE